MRCPPVFVFCVLLLLLLLLPFLFSHQENCSQSLQNTFNIRPGHLVRTDAPRGHRRTTQKRYSANQMDSGYRVHPSVSPTHDFDFRAFHRLHSTTVVCTLSHVSSHEIFVYCDATMTTRTTTSFPNSEIHSSNLEYSSTLHSKSLGCICLDYSLRGNHGPFRHVRATRGAEGPGAFVPFHHEV